MTIANPAETTTVPVADGAEHAIDAAVTRADASGRADLARVLWWVLLVGFVAAAVGLRVHRLGMDAFDEDELYAVYIQGISPKAVGSVVARDGLHTNHPPLLAVPFLYWNYLWGTGEVEVRLFSVLTSLLSIGLTYWLAARLGGRVAGLAACAFLALNPLHIAYAREARHYAYLVALVAASHLAFINSLTRGRRWDHLAYFVLAILTAMTHYFGAVALMGHAAVMLWGMTCGGATVRRSAARSLVALGLGAIICSPWLLVTRYQMHQPWRHLEPITADSLTNTLLAATGTYGAWDHGIVAGLVLVAIIAFGLWASRGTVLAPRRDGSPGPFSRTAGLIAIGAGLAGVVAAWRLVPPLILTTARAVLDKYDYPASQVEAELKLIYHVCLLLPLAVALAGVVVVFWPTLDRSFPEPTPGKPDAPIPVPILVGLLIVTPIAAIGVLSVLNIPILQTRNLIVLLPALAVGVGLGVAALVQSSTGRGLAIAAVALFLVTVARYQQVAMPFGGSGIEMGSVTPDWRVPADWLNQPDVPRLPIVAATEPLSDPVKWYMKDHEYIRLKLDAEWAKLPPDFHYLYIAGDEFSDGVRDRLRASGVVLTEVWQHDRFIIYRATRPTA